MRFMYFIVVSNALWIFFPTGKNGRNSPKKMSNEKNGRNSHEQKKEVDDLLKKYFNLPMFRLPAQIYSEQGEKGSRRFVKKIL